MEPPRRKHFLDPEASEPLGKRPTLQRQESRQDPFALAKSHFQEFATRWAGDSRLLQLLHSTSQNREFPRRFQQYYVNNRTQVATISVLKHMVRCVKAALQKNSTLQIPTEHIEGACGIMFSDYVVEELRWLQNNAPAYLRALMVETMVHSQANLWRGVPLAVIDEFQRLAFQRLSSEPSAHNLFLSSLAANHYPEAIMDVFGFLLQTPQTTDHTLLINETVGKIRSLHLPLAPNGVIEQFRDMEIT